MTTEVQKIPGKMKMPVRIEWLELNGLYEGFKVRARVNPTMKMAARIASGNFDLMTRTLHEHIIYEWNFVDENGDYLGDPSTDTIEQLPIDLINAIAEKIVEVVTNTPKN